jgi:hypothetical protein
VQPVPSGMNFHDLHAAPIGGPMSEARVILQRGHQIPVHVRAIVIWIHVAKRQSPEVRIARSLLDELLYGPPTSDRAGRAIK